MHVEAKEFLGFILSFGEIDGNPMQKRIYLTKEMVGAPKKVLDVGCSGGWLDKFYFRDTERVRVFGITNNNLECRKMKKCGIKPILFDFNTKKKLPFKGGSFDFVLGGEVIEHMLYPKFFIEEAHRVLKPGGRIVLSTPNGFHVWARLKFLFGRQPPVLAFEEHLRLYGKREILDLLMPYFTKIRAEYCTDRVSLPFFGSLFASQMVFSAFRK